MKKSSKTALFLVGFSALLFSCASTPLTKEAPIVEGFDKARYLGKWYEIARFDFAFEKNLNNTTAEYGLRDDGKISVTNRGYNYVKGKWTEAKAKARFVGAETRAALEVSFFGPFYSGYNVIALDKDYNYALVAGDSLKYLWILSRSTTIPEEVKNEYLVLATSLGYDIADLVWVEHDK
jgi:apolipoprotein D and lipocalin family protein